MSNPLKKQYDLNNTFLIKTKKIISIMVVLFLLMTVMDSVSSSSVLLSNDSKKVIEDESDELTISSIEEEIKKENLSEITDYITDSNEKIPDRIPRTFRRYTLSDALKRYLKFIGFAQTSLFMFYTNYSGYETSHSLKLFRFVDMDVNGDGNYDISVKIRLYPYIEKELSLSVNFQYLIKRLDDFPDIYESFEAYGELYFPGFLLRKQKDDRIRVGYDSPEGEEVPSKCDITYQYLPYIFRIRKRQEHRAILNPGSSIGNSKLALIFSYTNFQGEDIASEVQSRTIYDPAVKSKLTIGGNGIFGGRTFEFVREVSQETKIDMTCTFEKNNTEIIGYVKDLPEKVTFTVDHGKEGFVDFDTHGSPPTEIGLCDDFTDPKNFVYFKDLPSKARIDWKRDILKKKKFNISFYTIGPGISFHGHFGFITNGTLDFNISSKENLDCSLSIDGSEGYLVFDRCAVDISFSLSFIKVNTSLNLSFNMERFFDKPFEIYFGKLMNEEIQFSLASRSFTLKDFNLILGLQTGEFGIKAGKLLKERNGSIFLNFSYLKDEGNLSFICEVYVINGIDLYNVSLGFNGVWSPPQDIILIGNTSRILEFFCESGGFEYFVSEDSSWGYFYFKGNFSYASYRNFIINNVTGGFKGKISAKTGNRGLNISWYTEKISGYNITKINVSGMLFGLENFHLFYGDKIDFYIPHLYGNVLLREVCNESGYFYVELIGGQSHLDLNLSFNFTKEINSSVIELIVKVKDFHLDHGDKSVLFEAIWEDKNLSSLVFHSENNINFSVKNMYIFFGRNGSPIVELNNLTGYLKGYSGFDVDIKTPLNYHSTGKTKNLDSSDFSFSFELTDVELDLEIQNLTALVPIGSFKIVANTVGTVRFGLLNMSREIERIYTPLEVNVSWGNITFGFDSRYGELNLDLFEYKNVESIFEVLFGFLIPNFTGLPSTTFAIENLSFSGYSKLIIPLGMVNNTTSFVGIKFENKEDTHFDLVRIYLQLPELPIFDGYPKIYLENLKLGEGNFLFIFGFIGFYFKMMVTERIQGFKIGGEISDLFKVSISLDKPIDYFNLVYNPGLNQEGKKYFFLDTKNSTVSFNMQAKATSEFLNNFVDIFNNMTNITIPYIENDKGLRVDHATIKANKFCVFLNFSDKPLYKGYMHIFGDGSIYHIVDGSWEPLFPGGDGFSFIIEENHLQLKFDMAVQDLPIDFEIMFDNTGNKLIFSGIFSIYSDDLIFDIWWNLEDGYVKIYSNNDRSLDVENFIFKFINDSIEKINIQIDLISFVDGSYNLLFDTNKKIFELDFGGSIFSIEGFDTEFNKIPISGIGNSTINVEFDYFNLLEGFAVFQSYLGSEEYNWSIGSQRGIEWFELAGLKGSIEGMDKPLIHFEAGVGLLKWNRSSNNFLRMIISRNASEGFIKFDRHSNLNGSISIKEVFIRYIIPNTKIPIGTRLRSLSAENQRNDHEYFNLEWKKEEFIDIKADIAASWEISFERFFDVFNLISRIDLISSSVDVNFSLHYEFPPDDDTAHYLKFDILEKSSIELFEIINHYPHRFDKILTLGEMKFNPGEISFSWFINNVTKTSEITINNNGVTGDFAGLTLRKGFYKIKLFEASIIYPGGTYIKFNQSEDNGSLYISNSAELEFSVLEFSEGIDFLRIERDLEFGIITMLPGEFKASWINISDEDYDKELTINNGVFELTFTRFTLQLGNLKVSLSLFKTDRIFDNDITVKLRQRGKGNRGFCITTDNPLQFDLLSFKLSGLDWEFIIDLVELKANFSEWYLGMWDGKFTIGGNGSVKIDGLSRFINITFRWKGEDGKEQTLVSQYCSYWQNHLQSHALTFDTNNCTEQLDIVCKTVIDGLMIDNQMTIYPQKYLTLHFDMNPEPIDNTIDGHIFIDTEDEEVGNLCIEFKKHVDYFDLDVGLYTEIELMKADEFYVWGEFVEIEIFGMKLWVPSDWSKSGSIDFVNVGLVKLIFGNYETEIWPCTPKAILDKNQYGFTYEDPIVTFDASESEGFAFNIQWMRWDWDGDGNWDTGSGPYYWIKYEDLVEHNFSDILENGEDSVETFFQVKTVAAKSNIAEVTVSKGYVLDVDVQYDEKLYEFKEFDVIVTNATGNDPVVNALVTFYQYNSDGSINVSTNYTDSSGKAGFFAFAVPYDYYTHFSNAKVYIEAEGYFDGESKIFKVYDTDADLHGFVRDYVTHIGVSNALLVSDPGGYYTYSEYYSGMQNGRFKLIVPPGIYDITVSKDGFTSITLEDVDAIQGGYQYLGDLYLPPDNYGGLRGIVYDATNGYKELVGVQVTVEIPGEDDIFTTTNYFGEFPDNYPTPTNEYYSIDLEPGTYSVKFEKDNYYTITEQLVIVAGEITEIEVYLYPKWVTPSKHNNPSEWNDEEDSHDDKLNTYSYTDIYWGSNWHWTESLELSLSSSFTCDRVRIYAKYIENRCDQTKIEIYYNNAWHEVYKGSYEHKSWYVIDFDDEFTISKARVSFRTRKYLGIPTIAELFEFDFGMVQP